MGIFKKLFGSTNQPAPQPPAQQPAAAPVVPPAPRPVPQPVQQRPVAPAPDPRAELVRGLEETIKTVPDQNGSLRQNVNTLKLFSDQQAPAAPRLFEPYPIQKSLGGGFRLERKENYLIIYKDDKEFFDGDVLTERGDLILASGFRANSEAIAFIGSEGVLAIRKTESSAEAARVLPSGDGVVLTDDDKLLIFSKEGVKAKSFVFGSVLNEQRALADVGCASVDEDENGEDACVLRFFCFESQTAWRKKLKFSLPDDVARNETEPRVSVSPACIAVKMPDGVVHRFALDGAKQ